MSGNNTSNSATLTSAPITITTLVDYEDRWSKTKLETVLWVPEPGIGLQKPCRCMLAMSECSAIPVVTAAIGIPVSFLKAV